MTDCGEEDAAITSLVRGTTTTTSSSSRKMNPTPKAEHKNA